MNRYLNNFFLSLAICISVISYVSVLAADDVKNNIKIDTSEEAAEFASKLANEKAQNSFGVSPFSPNSYSAKLIDSIWHWGKIEPPGIRGYSAEVKFNIDGSDQNVRVVLHTDKMFINNRGVPIEKELIKQHQLQPENKDNIDKP